MTKTKKFWLGFFTFLPVLTIGIYFVFFAYLWFGMFFRMDIGPEGNEFPTQMFSGFAVLFLLILITVISSFVILIYYVLHANKHFNQPDNQKIMWILVLVLAGGIGNIVYFFVVIMPLKDIKARELITK